MSRKKFEKIHQKKACLTGRVWHYCAAMNAQQIIDKLATRKGGGVFWVSYSGQPSGLRAYAKRGENGAGDIRKSKCIPLQVASYENRKAVREAIAKGERQAPKMPDWMEYVEPLGDGKGGAYIGRHKEKGTLYLCAPKQDIAEGKTTYTQDGAKVEFEAIKQHFTPSALTPRPSKSELNAEGQDEFRRIKSENLVEIS